MKTISFFSILFAMLTLPLTATSSTSTSIDPDSNEPVITANFDRATTLPDLKVSVIATPGGLKKGNCNKVRVMVTNSQSAGVSQQIPVILFISQQGQQPTSHLGFTSDGIGANDNYGQPVWFHDLPIGATGTVTLKAKVNADLEIEESVPNNNDKIQTANVVGQCASTSGSASNTSSSSSSSASSSSKTSKKGYMLMTYNSRKSTRGGKKTPVAQAKVVLTKGRQSYTGMTGRDGNANITVPEGYYTLKISKRGCKSITKKYRVSGRSGQVGLSCR